MNDPCEPCVLWTRWARRGPTTGRFVVSQWEPTKRDTRANLEAAIEFVSSLTAAHTVWERVVLPFGVEPNPGHVVRDDTSEQPELGGEG